MNLGLAPRRLGFFQKNQANNHKVHSISQAEMLEDLRILKTLDQIKDDLSLAHQNFDETTNETLIDVYIYEIKSLHMKFKYYHEICKERGLIR